MLDIVVPMAGRGSRFANEGYIDPKPLIPIHGMPMIRLVIENLRPSRPHRFIFVCQALHVAEYGLAARFAEWAPGCEIVTVQGVTEGAACTVLAASGLLGDNPLMIANSDQYVDILIDDYLAAMKTADGLIMTMNADDPKWSFVGIDSQGRVERVVEKEVISNEATVGIYNFRRGADFVSAATEMIARNERVNNEFYVAPVYNQMIAQGGEVTVYNVGDIESKVYGLGTPADLELFKSLPISLEVTR